MSVRVPLGRGSFERIGAPTNRLINMLYELNPANQEDQVSFLQRPGLSLYKTCGTGPIRGIIQFGAFLIVVSGSELYKISSAGTVTQITGTIGGTLRVSMATNGTYVLIGTGTNLYQTDAFTMATITIGGSAISVSSVGYLAGYFLIALTNTQRIHYSAVGDITFAALDYFEAEFSPDIVASITVIGDYAYLLGTQTIEPWSATGNADAPFQRMRGRVFNVGTADKSTCCILANGLYFVGSDRVAYRMDGSPVRVSDHGIDEQLRAATDLRAWTYVLDGHGLWIISTGNETLVYDVTTQQWTEFKTYGLGYFRAHLGLQTDPVPLSATSVATLGADAVNGKIWTLTAGVSQDDSGPMVREWTGALDVSDGTTRCDNVILDATVGSAALDDDPMVEFRTSDDLTRSWTDWRSAPLGRSGETRQKIAWTRNGPIRPPGRAFHFRTAANCNVTVRKAIMNGKLR